MCFQLFISASVAIPKMHASESAATPEIEVREGVSIGLAHPYAGISTEDIPPSHPIRSILEYPHVKYLSSSNGCGCGFRNAWWDEADQVDLEANPWIREVYACWFDGYDDGIFIQDSGAAYIGDGDNINQHQLANLLNRLIQNGATVQLYGCWEGDEKEPVEKRAVIFPEQVRDYQFAFFPHYLYTVTRKTNSASLK
jgi:hypothetical protein